MPTLKTQDLIDRGIFEQFHLLKLKDYLGDEAIREAIREYNRTFTRKSKGLFIFGQTNTGKSLLANVVAKSVLAKGMDVQVLDSEGVANLYKSTFDGDREAWNTKVVEPDLLVIDKLERLIITDMLKQAVLAALDRRCARARPTVIVSALSLLADKHSVVTTFGSEIADVIDKTCIQIQCPKVQAWERKSSTLKRIKE